MKRLSDPRCPPGRAVPVLEPPVQITAHYEPDLSVMRRALRRASGPQRRKLLASGSVLLACGFVSMAVNPHDGTSVEYVAAFGGTALTAIGGFYLFLFVTVVASLAKTAVARFRVAEPVTYVLTDDRLSMVMPSEESSVSWRLIGRITEYADMWVLARADNPGYVWCLPKVAFTPSDVEAFRQFVAIRHQIGRAPVS